MNMKYPDTSPVACQRVLSIPRSDLSIANRAKVLVIDTMTRMRRRYILREALNRIFALRFRNLREAMAKGSVVTEEMLSVIVKEHCKSVEAWSTIIS